MSSTSILHPAVRYVPVRRQRRSSQLKNLVGRQLRPGSRRTAQRRALLEARWRQTLERITALSIAYHDAAQLASAGLPASHGARSRQARRLAHRVVAERQVLAEIDAALERITAGRYGWCEQCGRLIAAARLAAQPHARYCMACDREPVPALLPGSRAVRTTLEARQAPRSRRVRPPVRRADLR
jgi:RNA polymerase-binding transcription factor